MTDYRFETFRPSINGDQPDAQTNGYIQAVRAGFHDKSVSGKALADRVRRAIADQRVFTAAYTDNTAQFALETEIPVATFAHFEKQVNVGMGRLIPAHLITWVTVRPTHRRRGLLRAMMTENLANAHSAGYPFAALTVTEGGIYRRFGFGTASWMSDIEVDTSPGLQFFKDADRRVEMCHAKQLAEIAPGLYEKFQKTTPGAMGRQQSLFDRSSGEDIDKDETDPMVRGAIHYDEAGEPDGFVSFKYTHDGNYARGTLNLLDFIAVSDEAYASLWHFLAAVDLTTTVRFQTAAQQSPLSWLITDPRRVKTVRTYDAIWLRMLDVKKAFEARAWLVGGELTIKVADSMGFVDGVYRIESDGQDATVEKIKDTDSVDLAMDVAELSSLYLGGADPVVMARAGRIDEVRPGAALEARSLFALERAPYTPNDF